jgi:hypothetical protein
LVTAARKMPVVRIKPSVLDGDKRPRQIGRQILQRNIGARHFAAHRQHAAVDARDLDGRWPFRNFERLDRRQMCADPDQHADHCDNGPQADHRPPVEHAVQAAAHTTSRLAFTARLAHTRLSRGRGIVVILIVSALR